MSGLHDRDLLLAVLAVQSEFMSSESLIEALRSWDHDSSQSLAQVLISQRRLSAANLAALETIINGLITRRSGSTDHTEELGKTAASGGGDSEEVHGDSTLPTGAFASDSHSATDTQREGRFRVIRPHAEGGLGVVYIAQDSELNRLVALKEIKPSSADDPENRARFLREAEITGRLEHPGIVPVYSLGRFADGRPYYAMLLIRGESLDDAIKQFHRKKFTSDGTWMLELRRLLQRFISVCQAVEYAHSREVLHRDLKPSNVMLGRYGETYVVDWGLARAETAEETEEMQPTMPPNQASRLRIRTDVPLAATEGTIGTLAYMPPEQADGRVDELRPTSDVYSLGATLYQLLTNQPPITGTRKEVFTKIRQGIIPSPLSINGRIPKELEAICQKALALRPQDRYQSAGGLADDIERYLGDQPVQALPEELPAKIQRTMRRHRPWVQAGIAALVLVTFVTTFFMVRAWRDAQLKRRSLQATTDLLDIMNKVLGEPFPQYGAVGFEKRQPVLRLTRELNAWIATYGQQEFSRHLVLSLIWQGNLHAEIGEGEAAADYFQKAEDRAKGMPPNYQAALAPLLAEMKVRAAYSLDALGKHLEADKQYLQVIDAPQTDVQQRAAAKANYYYAESLFKRGNHQEAATYAEQAVKIVEELRASGQPERYDDDLDQACHMLGKARAANGQFTEALQLHRRAGERFRDARQWLTVLKKDPASHPFDPSSPNHIAACTGLLDSISLEVSCLIPLGRLNEAVLLLNDQNLLRSKLRRDEKTIAAHLRTNAQMAAVFNIWRPTAAEKLLAQYESWAEFRHDENAAYYEAVLGRARTELRLTDQAKISLLRAQELYRAMANSDPAQNSSYWINVAICQSNLGRCLHLAGDVAIGEQNLREAIAALERSSLDVSMRDALATSYTYLGELLLQDPARRLEAVAALANAVRLRQQLVTDSPHAQLYQCRLAQLLLGFEPIRDTQRAAELRNSIISQAEIEDKDIFRELLTQPESPQQKD